MAPASGSLSRKRKFSRLTAFLRSLPFCIRLPSCAGQGIPKSSWIICGGSQVFEKTTIFFSTTIRLVALRLRQKLIDNLHLFDEHKANTSMPTAAILRRQIEANLANRIPSALTPAPRTMRPVVATGIQTIDELLQGGLPLGAIAEIVGPECSGRTSFALSFLTQMTQAQKVCAWIDVSDMLDLESAAAAGVDLSRLLWVHCGVQTTSRARHQKNTPSLFPRSTCCAAYQEGSTWWGIRVAPAQRGQKTF
jgi:hypothetical protein